MTAYEELNAALSAVGQEQLLRFWDELDDAGRSRLAAQIRSLDLNRLEVLIAEHVLRRQETRVPDDLRPAAYFPAAPRDGGERELYRAAEAKGRELISSGRVAVMTVAGGQGTRLGYDGPKGTFPIAPVSGKSLFQYFAETLLRSGKKHGRALTWYIMTSEFNRKATEDFFEKHGFFGMDAGQVVFFTQGTMPAIGYDGKLLLASRDSLALSPDGHGGTLLALKKSGALERMAREGTEVISYFQVDNPLAPAVYPLFVGLHELEESEMSSIMLPKTGPFEKLGNFCVRDGKLRIIEYSDLPDELAQARNADGTLSFIAGSPAIHLISRNFIERLTADNSLHLPWHRADKKVSCLDGVGRPVVPEKPNAVKLESFIFDALPLAGKTMILEGDRSAMFAPTKNRSGVDSVDSCRAMLMERDARWLESAGVTVPRNADGSLRCRIEFSPLAAVDPADASDYVKRNGVRGIAPGEERYLE